MTDSINPIQDTLTHYLDTVQKTRSPKTHATYQQAMNKFVETVGDDAPLTEATYIKFLVDTSNMNASTQATYRTAVLGFYMFYAVEHAGVNIPALREATKRYGKRLGETAPEYNFETVEKLIEYCFASTSNLIELRDRAFIILLADSGLRIAEACSLTRGAVDWREARVKVIGKGNKEAWVRVSERFIETLRDYIKARSKFDRASGKSAVSLPLFARHDIAGQSKTIPIDPGGMWSAIKHCAMRGALDSTAFRVHDFRHYFVSRVYAATNDIVTARDLARHKSITTTSRYTHLNEKLDETYHKIFNGGSDDNG